MIEVKNVCLSYIKEYSALYNISFEVKDGERLAVIGDNESGKTSLLRAIARLEKIDRGEIYLNRININKINFSKDVNVVYLSSKPLFFENQSVFYNLQYVLKIRKISDEIINKKIYNALKLLEIENLKELKIRDLTDREKKLVALARAGLRKSDIYLIDDIFTGNESENEKIVNFLNAIIEKEASCLFTLTNNHAPLIEALQITKQLHLENGSIAKER